MSKNYEIRKALETGKMAAMPTQEDMAKLNEMHKNEEIANPAITCKGLENFCKIKDQNESMMLQCIVANLLLSGYKNNEISTAGNEIWNYIHANAK